MIPNSSSRARLYTAWKNMRQRCLNSACPDFHLYGGRGISICPEWQNSFSCFMAWAVENGYRDDLTLDRIDTNGPYGPENCRWATRKVQANNRRTTRLLTMDGRTQSMRAWAEELDIDHSTIWRRLYYGWPVERALTEPVHIEKRSRGVRS